MQNGLDPVRHRAGRTATLVSVATNLLLTLLQIIVGVFAHSQALIADAIHTLSDLLADGVVLAANAQSRKAPDDDHQYGHLRFETAASMVLGVLLMSVGAGMLWKAFGFLQDPSSLQPVHPAALVVALMALAGKEALFRYMLRVGQRIRSTMLVANAWHARSDAASSLVVALGIIANLAGFTLADPLAALVVGLMIFRMGWKFFSTSFGDLMDRAVDTDTENRIRGHLLSTPGVLGIHDLKTRKLGDMIWVEVDIEMDGSLSIAEGHEIAVRARARVMENEPVLEVMTHFDPVDPNDPRFHH
ncbi:MAG TPA: cation diffusion facilitator family transporter [Pusillimonas sp.]|uniref:cation diffusion facilitator family transporter n=1 Tax=unclassified Pusillimonas TaxID=2640016 RepID=UPI0026081ED8|nr:MULTISPECIES: cation diffusion facilitator family transporter [unclassified Pusillimonas]HLU18599.1 cation diffusion facilitator family transporter [Pusillimonas sp.]